MRAAFALFIAIACFFAAASAQCMDHARLSTQGWEDSSLAGITSIVAGQPVTTVDITPNQQRVVYRTQAGKTNTANELYSVPATGGNPIKISRGLVATGTVRDFRIVNDANVAYVANAVKKENNEFWLTSTTAQTARRLNPSVPAMETVARNTETDYRFDATRIYFRGSFSQTVGKTRIELYSVPIAGTDQGTRISAESTTGDVTDFQVGTSKVVYRGPIVQADSVDLFSTNLATEMQIQLNNNKANSMVRGTDYRITADNVGVHYVADNNANKAGQELYYAVLTQAKMPTRISDENLGGRVFTRYVVAGVRVVYQAAFDMEATHDLLYTTAPTMADVRRMMFPKATGSKVQAQWTADDTNIHFIANIETAHNLNALYQIGTNGAAPMAAGDNNRISQMAQDGNVLNFKRGGNRIAYSGDITAANGTELFSTAITSMQVNHLNPASVAPAANTLLDYFPNDGNNVVFMGTYSRVMGVSNREIYRNSLSGGTQATAVRLAAPELPDSKMNFDVQLPVQFTSTNSRLTFWAKLSFDNAVELYSVQPGGAADSAVKLNDALNAGQSVTKSQITGNDQLVVFISPPTGKKALFTAPIAGSPNPNVRLSQDPVRTDGPNNEVTDFRLFENGVRTLYNGALNLQTTQDLYSVCTGASAPVAPPATGGSNAGGTSPTGGPTGNGTTVSNGSGTGAPGATTTASPATTHSVSFVLFAVVLLVASLF